MGLKVLPIEGPTKLAKKKGNVLFPLALCSVQMDRTNSDEK